MCAFQYNLCHSQTIAVSVIKSKVMNNVIWLLLALGSSPFIVCIDSLEDGPEIVGEDVSDNTKLIFAHVVSKMII